ncbi:MAG: GIY-YIG nuclease family protein [Bacteroidetes bacterium]|nr:GIY-YIG nuclease family protein [Bacteroidota bacterium]
MVVYLIENLINGKKYVGMDSKNNPKYLGSGTLIVKAIKKYGRENFKKHILEECSSIEELELRESWWIESLNALKCKDFYNLEDNRKRGVNPFANKTAKEMNEIKAKIFTPERNKKISIANQKPKPKGFGDKVRKIHLGRVRSDESKEKQSKTLKGRISPNKGGKWSEESKNKFGKSILQYDIDGNFIKEWDTITQASKALNIKGINENLKNRSKTSGGYIWKYKNNKL